MFNEFSSGKGHSAGWIEAICGPMFSGKTEELIRRLKRAKIANQPIAIFKPEIDVRYNEQRIVSHDANYFPSMPIASSEAILKHRGDAKVVALDEAQFFDNDLPSILQQLALDGVRVIIAGLDLDYKGNPFGIMPQLLAIADYITKLNAVCVVCGGAATHSYRKVTGRELVMLGEKESYEPRCRYCFFNQV
ncbi:MAG: thymidine kinase [Bacteroidota bacterium]|nr:thymidine kinase [Bacteroidota bacterium]